MTTKTNKKSDNNKIIENKFDNELSSILQKAKSFSNFFDIIFAFLAKRTDFFQLSKKFEVTLEPSVSARILRQSFDKYKTIAGCKCKHSSCCCAKPVLPNPCYGAKFQNYSWSQNLSELQIHVKVPADLKKEDLKINITDNEITIKDANNILLNGKFCKKIKPDKSRYSLTGYILQVNLAKDVENWWDCFLTSEPKINLELLKPDKSYGQLLDEAKAKMETLKNLCQQRKQN